MDIDEGKKEVALFMARCYNRGLTTATGGNISMRIGDIMLITPSGKDKASLVGSDIAEVRIADGVNLTPDKKLSIESGMHRLIYLKRNDVKAVVHSHSTFSCLFSASEEEKVKIASIKAFKPHRIGFVSIDGFDFSSDVYDLVSGDSLYAAELE